MIYVTGDIHGEADRLSPEALKQRGIDMQPDDYIIVCGYFGHFHVDYVRDDSVAAWMYKDVVPVGR